MKDLDLSNAEGLDESITENYSSIAPRFLRGTAQVVSAAARPTLNLEIAPVPTPALELPIETLGAGTAINTVGTAINTPTAAQDAAKNISIKPKLDAINIAPKSIRPAQDIKIAELGVAEAETIKTLIDKKAEESAEDKTESKSEKTETEGDKILGMPKMVAYGLGAVIVLVGGFIAYKKFKK
jgi:hypothetical protein